MTSQAVEAPQVSDAVIDASPWQRLLALSGVAFAPLFVVGWLASAVSDSPNYVAAQEKWIKWAHHDHIKGQAFASVRHVADAGYAGNVCHFMRVDNCGRYTARDKGGCKLRWNAQAALDMNVRVD